MLRQSPIVFRSMMISLLFSSPKKNQRADDFLHRLPAILVSPLGQRATKINDADVLWYSEDYKSSSSAILRLLLLVLLLPTFKKIF